MKLVLENNDIKTDDKIKLIDELRKNNPTSSDRWTYRTAIWILGAAVIITLIFIYCLALNKVDIPDSLIAIGSTVAGGIAGTLTSSNRTSSNNNS